MSQASSLKKPKTLGSSPCPVKKLTLRTYFQNLLPAAVLCSNKGNPLSALCGRPFQARSPLCSELQALGELREKPPTCSSNPALFSYRKAVAMRAAPPIYQKAHSSPPGCSSPEKITHPQYKSQPPNLIGRQGEMVPRQVSISPLATPRPQASPWPPMQLNQVVLRIYTISHA